MGDDEINKIITEFMGWNLWSGQFAGIKYNAEIYVNHKGNKCLNNFTEDLNLLTLVWEKLKADIQIETEICPEEGFLGYEVGILTANTSNLYSGTFSSIQQAAAYVTAKAILELNKGDL